MPAGSIHNIGEAVKTYYNEYYLELQGLADQFALIGHPEINVDYLSTWVYIHEIPHA